MSYVTFEQFAARYARIIPEADEEKVQAYLDDACALVDLEAGTAYTDETVPAAVIPVAIAAALRAYENPMGLSMEVAGSYTWATSAGGQLVYLTMAERRIVRRAAGKTGITSVDMQAYLPDTSDEQYLDVAGSPEPLLYFAEDDLP